MILCAVSIRKICKDKFRGTHSVRDSSSWIEYKYPRITYRELVEATEEFSVDRLVGIGSYGRVYRGTLRDGTVVAVKVLQHLQTTGNSIKTFNRECQVLRRIRHRNLMRILTVCSQPDFKALVKPFMANGSLERCLYATPAVELSLVQRVSICSDVAEGMAYLHEHSPVKIIHCDLKPSNVLLNDDMTALVSDFGIAKLITSTDDDSGASTTNMLRGSIGYIPPEHGYISIPTTKGDMYSFGVLVLEMVTKKKPTDEMFEAGLSLRKWVKIHNRNHADAVVDPELVRMVRDQTPEVRRVSDVAIAKLLELGILCTQEQPSARPTMMDAANNLNRLKHYLSSEAPRPLPHRR